MDMRVLVRTCGLADFPKIKSSKKTKGDIFFPLTCKITQSENMDMRVLVWTCGLADFPKIKKLKKSQRRYFFSVDLENNPV